MSELNTQKLYHENELTEIIINKSSAPKFLRGLIAKLSLNGISFTINVGDGWEKYKPIRDKSDKYRLELIDFEYVSFA